MCLGQVTCIFKAGNNKTFQRVLNWLSVVFPLLAAYWNLLEELLKLLPGPCPQMFLFSLNRWVWRAYNLLRSELRSVSDPTVVFWVYLPPPHPSSPRPPCMWRKAHPCSCRLTLLGKAAPKTECLPWCCLAVGWDCFYQKILFCSLIKLVASAWAKYGKENWKQEAEIEVPHAEHMYSAFPHYQLLMLGLPHLLKKLREGAWSWLLTRLGPPFV